MAEAIGDVATEEDGGWSYEFIGVVEKDFECTVCLLPLREPYLTKCGHSMCKVCLDKVIERNPICPEDRRPISRDDIFPDLKCQRKILALHVKCPYADTETHGCTWTGELVDLLKKHLDLCKSEKIKCTRLECDAILTRETFRAHLKNDCPMIPLMDKVAMKQIERYVGEKMADILQQQQQTFRNLQDEIAGLKVQLDDGKEQNDRQEQNIELLTNEVQQERNVQLNQAYEITLLRKEVEYQWKISEFSRSLISKASGLLDLVPDTRPKSALFIFDEHTSKGWISRFDNGWKFVWRILKFKEFRSNQMRIKSPLLMLNTEMGLKMRVTLTPGGYRNFSINKYLSFNFEISREVLKLGVEYYKFEVYVIDFSDRDNSITIANMRKDVNKTKLEFCFQIQLEQLSPEFIIEDTLIFKVFVT